MVQISVVIPCPINQEQREKNCFCSLLPSWRLRGTRWSFLGRTLPDHSALSLSRCFLDILLFLISSELAPVLCFAKTQHQTLDVLPPPEAWTNAGEEIFMFYRDALCVYRCLAFFPPRIPRKGCSSALSGQADLWDAASTKWLYKVSDTIWIQQKPKVIYAT